MADYVDVWQKPTQCCKAIICQLKKKNVSKDKANQGALPLYGLPRQPKFPSDPDILGCSENAPLTGSKSHVNSV